MKHLLAATLTALTLAGCQKDPTSAPIASPPAGVVNGVYILNEGKFSDATGARLSLYDIDKDSLSVNVYESANGNNHLGNLGDDIKIYNGRVYLLMSGSCNLNVIRLSDNVLLQTKTYAGDAPHDLLIDSVHGRAYITKLFKGSIFAINLATLDLIDTVRVGQNPLGMAISGNRLFVCNSGYGLDRTVTVVDVRADTVEATLTLHDGPSAIARAADGTLWIACAGGNNGKMFRINPTTLAIEDSIVFAGKLGGGLALRGGKAFVNGEAPGAFSTGPLHMVDLATKAVTTGFIAGNYYAIAVDPPSGDIYLSDAKSFNENGEVSIYTAAGVLKRRFAAQIVPGAFAFNHP